MTPPPEDPEAERTNGGTASGRVPGKDSLMDDSTHGGPSGRAIRIAVIAFCAVVWLGVVYYALA